MILQIFYLNSASFWDVFNVIASFVLSFLLIVSTICQGKRMRKIQENAIKVKVHDKYAEVYLVFKDISSYMNDYDYEIIKYIFEKYYFPKNETDRLFELFNEINKACIEIELMYDSNTYNSLLIFKSYWNKFFSNNLMIKRNLLSLEDEQKEYIIADYTIHLSENKNFEENIARLKKISPITKNFLEQIEELKIENENFQKNVLPKLKTYCNLNYISWGKN